MRAAVAQRNSGPDPAANLAAAGAHGRVTWVRRDPPSHANRRPARVSS